MLKQDSFNDYVKNEGINASSLKVFDSKLRHLNPIRLKFEMKQKQKPQNHFIIGRAIHEYLLEPHVFKEQGEFYQAVMGDKFLKMLIESVDTNKTLRKIVESPKAKFESSCYVEEDGVKLKARFDIHYSDGYLFDVKTNRWNVNYALEKWDYLLQAQFYSKVYEIEYNIKVKAFYFIFVNLIDAGISVYKVPDVLLQDRKRIDKLVKEWLALKNKLKED